MFKRPSTDWRIVTGATTTRRPNCSCRRTVARCVAVVGSVIIAGCRAPARTAVGAALAAPTAFPSAHHVYDVVTTRSLRADGPNTGRSAYDLIRAFGGPRPIESPDLYSNNHPGAAHIYEDSDDEVGDHFVFVIHRDDDVDRDRHTDRQRNEIKAYGRSDRAVKAFEGETLVYEWKFKIHSKMQVSKRFSHFFQLKAVGGVDAMPIVTLSGAKRRGGDRVEVRYAAQSRSEVLTHRPWSAVLGEWMSAYCRVVFADAGAVRMVVARLRDGEVIFDLRRRGIDMWRGEGPTDFVRPKWGIYRSLRDRDHLRAAEDWVRFADFRVSKVRRRQ